MRIKELLLEILNHEESEEAKLDILTDIGLGTTNEEIFKATEDAREAIVSLCGEIKSKCNTKKKRNSNRNCTEQIQDNLEPQGCNENNGDV